MGVLAIEGHPGVEQRAFPPVLARVDEQTDAPAAGEKGIQRRTVAGDEREREVIAAADAQQQTGMIAAAGPFDHGEDMRDIGAPGHEALRAGEDEHVDLRLRPRDLERTNHRGREQDVADAPRHDNQNALRRRRELERTGNGRGRFDRFRGRQQ